MIVLKVSAAAESAGGGRGRPEGKCAHPEDVLVGEKTHEVACGGVRRSASRKDILSVHCCCANSAAVRRARHQRRSAPERTFHCGDLRGLG